MTSWIAALQGFPSKVDLATYLQSFSRWWIGELRQLVPTAWWSWLWGMDRHVVLCTVADDQIEFSLVRSRAASHPTRQISEDALKADSLAAFLRDHHLTAADVDLGIRLQPEEIFGRQLFVPGNVRNLDEIAVRDLVHKTPFRLDDVFHGYQQDREQGKNRLVVWQWIVKRTLVERVVSRLQLSEDDIVFVDAPYGTGGSPRPVIHLGHGLRQSQRWYWRACIGLVASALVLTLAVGGLKYWRQSSLLEQLDRDIAASSVQAREVRAKLDKIERTRAAAMRIHLQKVNGPSLLDAWLQITSILPEDTWLTEFQFERGVPPAPEAKLVLNGYSESAAHLVAVIGSKAMFRDTTLASPISLDPVEAKERFSLHAKLLETDAANTGAQK